jgi:hypothetical protein
MPKAKPKATIMVADGLGGLTQVQDRRFEPPRDWPAPAAPAWAHDQDH